MRERVVGLACGDRITVFVSLIHTMECLMTRVRCPLAFSGIGDGIIICCRHLIHLPVLLRSGFAIKSNVLRLFSPLVL